MQLVWLVLLLQGVFGAEFASPLHEFGDLALPCTDDSDCTPLGHKFGCFLYRCVFLPHLSYPTASPDTPVTSPSSPGA